VQHSLLTAKLQSEYTPSHRRHLQRPDHQQHGDPSATAPERRGKHSQQQATETAATAALQGLASSDHTTLLLNCYAKLRDTAKLDRFLRAEGPGGKPALSFDVDTAIKVDSGVRVSASTRCG
jgi:hypothetical protein